MCPTNNAKRNTSSFIRKIEVEKLFGQYDYDLEIPFTGDKHVSKIGLIYGDNGSGKTTILELIFHLLSPARNRGHRNFLTRVPFSRFSIVFSNKNRIDIARSRSKLTGDYTIISTKPRSPDLTAKVEVDENNRIRKITNRKKIFDVIEKLGLSIFFLRDDRRLQSDTLPEKSEELEEGFFIASWAEPERGRVTRRAVSNLQAIELDKTLQRTISFLNQRSILTTSRIESEARNVYANIVESMRIGIPQIKDYDLERNKLIKELKHLDKQSQRFTEYGLTSRVDVQRFIKALRTASYTELPSVAQVITSFIDGQYARLGAFGDLNKLLDQFVSIINGFLLDKKLYLKIGEGISIVSNSGTSLSPENLSSGEKQLLLLFCNVITASESASLFLIDEPEISLNVKWQRRLVDALKDITNLSSCQFLFATHSIELLAKHRDNVIKLSPLSK